MKRVERINNKAWYKLHFGSYIKTSCTLITDNSIKTARTVERKLGLIVIPIIKRGELQRRYYEDINGKKFYIKYGLTSKMIQSDWIKLKIKMYNDRLTIMVDDESTQMEFDL